MSSNDNKSNGQRKAGLEIEKFFDAETMSVHLRENAVPVAKRGVPGKWDFSVLRKEVLSTDELISFSEEIEEAANEPKRGFIEFSRQGSTICKIGDYRIVITRPPLSDGWEITAVRPVKKLFINDYNLSSALKERIDSHAEGILIAGSPGMGKSTFAQALAMHYASKSKIVKTIEAPRDLLLPPEITQYSMSSATPFEMHDILLLSRPDYTIFDEMRNTDDFALFSDLRLSGIGLAGVVHATRAIDAIQRFVGKIELGVIPQIIDTVIFIKNGKVEQVLSLEIKVKVPSGMIEADLARPVVVVSDFETDKPEYELYSYGNDTVVVPVSEAKRGAIEILAEEKLAQYFREYSESAKVELDSSGKCTVLLPEKEISKVIGKDGGNIRHIEEELGLFVEIKKLGDSLLPAEGEIPFQSKITDNGATFFLDPKHYAKTVSIIVSGEALLSANIGKDGKVKVSKAHKIGRMIIASLSSGNKVSIVEERRA